MNKYTVKFSRRAEAELRSIFSYIAEDNPTAALNMVDKIETRAKQLETTPFIGAELSQAEYPFLPSGYRRIIVNPFVIYYRVIIKTVYITHIIHERRNQLQALKPMH
jgi:toxin ParE1/3/4